MLNIRHSIKKEPGKLLSNTINFERKMEEILPACLSTFHDCQQKNLKMQRDDQIIYCCHKYFPATHFALKLPTNP